MSSRYRKLIAAGKSAPKAIVAVARELVGFIWAIARLVEPKAAAWMSRRSPDTQESHDHRGDIQAAKISVPKAGGRVWRVGNPRISGLKQVSRLQSMPTRQPTLVR